LSRAFPELVINKLPVFQSLDRVIDNCTDAIRLDPRATWRFLNRANAYLDLFRQAKEETKEEAEEETEEENEEENEEETEELTDEKIGALNAAIADYTEVIRLDPNYAEAYYGRGDAYLEKGDTDKADKDFDQANRLGFKP
jgi:tetratricopeptide (TPR) repeat protein